MPLAPYSHHEDDGGDPIFIIQTPNEKWSGTRLGMVFVNGEGRTRNSWVAQQLSETFGYLIMCPEDFRPDWARDKAPDEDSGPERTDNVAPPIQDSDSREDKPAKRPKQKAS